jgi:hypothetical protein
MRGLIGLFDIAREYSLHFTGTHTTLVHRVASSLPLPGSGFQWLTFLFPRFSELSPRLVCQLLTATAHNSWSSAVT